METKTYDENGVLVREYEDTDVSAKARASRYTEYLGLHAIPFMSEQQAQRAVQLSTLRVRDNHIAMNGA